MCVCFPCFVDVDGDLALIDPREPIPKGEKERKQEGRIWSRSDGRLQRGPKADTQASSSNSKPITPITVLKPMSIKDTPLLQYHNPIFNLQDTLNPNQITKHQHIRGDTSNPNQATQYLQMGGGGDTLNPNQATQYLQTGGDTSNPNQITKHQHIGGDTSNPNQAI